MGATAGTDSDPSARRRALRAALQAAKNHYDDLRAECARAAADGSPAERLEAAEAKREAALRAFRGALRAFAEAVLGNR